MGILSKVREIKERIEEHQDRARTQKEIEASAERIERQRDVSRKEQAGMISPQLAEKRKKSISEDYERAKTPLSEKVASKMKSGLTDIGASVAKEFGAPARQYGQPKSVRTKTVEGSGKDRRVTTTTTTDPVQRRERHQSTGQFRTNELTSLFGPPPGRKRGKNPPRLKDPWY